MASSWRIEVSKNGSSDARRETVIDADNWMGALRAGRQALGMGSEPLPGSELSCEFREDGSVQVSHSREQMVYVVGPATTKSFNKPAPRGPQIPADAVPPNKTSPGFLKAAEIPRPRVGGSMKTSPGTAVVPSPSSVSPTPSAAAAPVSGAVRRDSAAVAAPPRPAEPAPPAGPPAGLTRFGIRVQEPTADNKLLVHEATYAVADSAGVDEAEQLLRAELVRVQTELSSRPQGKLIALAAFDHTWTGKPKRGPLVTVTWRDWRDAEPEIKRSKARRSSRPPPAPASQPPPAEAPALRPSQSPPADDAASLIRSPSAPPPRPSVRPATAAAAALASPPPPSSPPPPDVAAQVVVAPAPVVVAAAPIPVAHAAAAAAGAVAPIAAAVAPVAAAVVPAADAVVLAADAVVSAADAVVPAAADAVVPAAADAVVPAADAVVPAADAVVPAADVVVPAADAIVPGGNDDATVATAASVADAPPVTTSASHKVSDWAPPAALASPASIPEPVPLTTPPIPLVSPVAPTVPHLAQASAAEPIAAAAVATPLPPAPAASHTPPPPPPTPSTAQERPSRRSSMPPRPRKSTGEATEERLAEVFERVQDLFFLQTAAEGCEFVLRLCQEMIPSEAASALLYDINADELRFVYVDGPVADKLKGQAVSRRRGILGLSTTVGYAIVVTDATNDPRLDRSVDERTGFATKSLLTSRVQMEGQLLGALQLVNSTSSRGYTEPDAHLLEYLAEQFADFLVQARLRSASAEQKLRKR